jgi:hypothetical protein
VAVKFTCGLPSFIYASEPSSAERGKCNSEMCVGEFPPSIRGYRHRPAGLSDNNLHLKEKYSRLGLSDCVNGNSCAGRERQTQAAGGGSIVRAAALEIVQKKL